MITIVTHTRPPLSVNGEKKRAHFMVKQGKGKMIIIIR